MPLVFLVLALLSGVAPAAELRLHVDTEDFRISQETQAALGRLLKRMAGFYEARLALHYPGRVDVQLLVVGDRARFDVLAAEVQMPHWSSGFYTRDGQAVVWGNRSEAQMLRVFLHESSHFLLGHGGRPSPMWANEGLAECFANARAVGNSVYLDPDLGRLRTLRGEKDAGRLRPVSDIVSQPGSWLDVQRQEAGLRYAYGWGLTFMLLGTPAGQGIVRDALADFGRTGQPANAVGVIEQHYPGGLEQLEEDWAEWVTRTPAAQVVPIVAGGSGGEQGGWVKCSGGRLARADDPNGCKRWVKQPDGTLRLE